MLFKRRVGRRMNRRERREHREFFDGLEQLGEVEPGVWVQHPSLPTKVCRLRDVKTATFTMTDCWMTQVTPGLAGKGPRDD